MFTRESATGNGMPVLPGPTPDPAKLREILTGYSFLRNYRLLLFSTDDTAANGFGISWVLPPGNHRSGDLPITAFTEILDIACLGNRPTTVRSREGLFIFAVPFSLSATSHFCLIGTGVRDSTLDLEGVELLAKITERNPVELLELLQKYPTVAKKEVEETADRVFHLIQELMEEKAEPEPGEDVLDKLSAVVGICAEIDKLPTGAAVLTLLLDTLIIIFDIPRLGIVFAGNARQKLFLTQDWAPPPAVITKAVPHRIHHLFPHEATGKSFILGGEIASIFTEHNTEMATCLQFLAMGDDCGLVALLDSNLPDSHISLVELVCSKAANRFQQLLQAEQLLRANTQSQKMLEMISSLLRIDDQNELYDSLLNTATGLVGAGSGSFMVVDKSGENLHIEAVKGINTHLAKSFTIKVGEGIAGKVAAGASPLLISNIENDARTARLNRSRFRTKSCVSLPFSYKRQVIGVLNIADKENGETFDEHDLEALTFFADHVAGVVHHAKAKEFCRKPSTPVVVDPLTGLYNRSLLHRRMQEEISRCKRQDRNVGLMRVELLGAGAAGKGAMQTIADVLRGMLREMDVVSLYGENLFCAMLPETGKKELRLVGERVRTRIIRALAQQEGSSPGDGCVTIGLSSFPEDGRTIDDMLRAAENDVFSPTAYNPVGATPISLAMERTAFTAMDLQLGSTLTHHDVLQLLPLSNNPTNKGS
jgi:diguanylate cyclase (GGDEF)-like protein